MPPAHFGPISLLTLHQALQNKLLYLPASSPPCPELTKHQVPIRPGKKGIGFVGCFLADICGRERPFVGYGMAEVGFGYCGDDKEGREQAEQRSGSAGMYGERDYRRRECRGRYRKRTAVSASAGHISRSPRVVF